MTVYNLTPDTFDPQLDSSVRVKIGRLRAKLLEYYAHNGRNDEVGLDIPKGSYRLESHYRQVPEPITDSGSGITALVVSIPPRWRRNILWEMVFLFVAVAFGGFGSFFAIRATHSTERVPDHLKQFWSGLAANGNPVVAAYSNPRLAGFLAHGGLHYYDDPSRKPDTQLNLGYAGAGDVQSVHVLNTAT